MTQGAPRAAPAAGPKLLPGDEGSDIARRLLIVRLARLREFICRSSALASRRISGLSELESQVLERLCETSPLSISELSAHTGRDVGQVSRTVTKLIGAGLAKRQSRGGGPGVAVTPTARGRLVHAPLAAEAEQATAMLTQGLSADDLKTLDRCMAVMMDNALARFARERGAQDRESGQEPLRRAV
jgi:DNA-binding MarR family transcriptional regulator